MYRAVIYIMLMMNPMMTSSKKYRNVEDVVGNGGLNFFDTIIKKYERGN